VYEIHNKYNIIAGAYIVFLVWRHV